MRALITGVLGQDGSYLAEYLLSKGYEVWGTVRHAVLTGLEKKVRAVYTQTNQTLTDGVTYCYADLRDEDSLEKVIRKCHPDEIYNLAGQVFVPTSWLYPAQTFDVNTGGLARILKVLDDLKCDAKVYQASSSEMFGNLLEYMMKDGVIALNEKHRMLPVSPYGVSKYAAHNLVSTYRQKGRFVVSGILFNHESPRRGPEMVTRKITMQVAKWFHGSTEELHLGNTLAKRDWGYAKDYVEAMHKMLQEPYPDDYVIGTGEAHSVHEFLEEAIAAAGLDYHKVFGDRVRINIDKYTRDNELHTLVADYRKASSILRWKPKHSFKQLVKTMVDSDIKNYKEHKETVNV